MRQKLFTLLAILLAFTASAEEQPIQPTYAGKQNKITTLSLKSELQQFRKLGKIIELRDRIKTQKLAMTDLEHVYKTTKKLGDKSFVSKLNVLKAKTDIEVAKADLAYLKAEQKKTISEALIQKLTILEQGDDEVDMRLEIALETDKNYDAHIAMYEAEIAKINASTPYYKMRMKIAEQLIAKGSGAISQNELALRRYEFAKAGEKIASINYLIKALKLAKKTLTRSVDKLAQ